jgi:hypothetical protein
MVAGAGGRMIHKEGGKKIKEEGGRAGEGR